MYYKFYETDTVVEFGRYKGKTIMDIALEDKKYLEWFIEEIDNVVLVGKSFDDIIKYLSENIISILEKRIEYIFSDDDCYEHDDDCYEHNDDCYEHNDDCYEHNDMWNNYSDNSYYYSDNDIWADIAGSDDPDDIETAYWNLD